MSLLVVFHKKLEKTSCQTGGAAVIIEAVFKEILGGIDVSSRMFQSVVLQMKDSVNRTVGVIDADGMVVACSELTCIGEHWSGAVAAVNGADSGIAYFEGKTFKPLAGWGAQFDYAAFVKGEDELAASLCAMSVVAFNNAKTYYEEKHDKATFVKNIISDNILLGDIYTQAKELHFVSEVPRAAFLVRQLGQEPPGWAKSTTITTLRRMEEKGLVERTWGNISARISDTLFVITPSGLAYEDLRPEQLALYDLSDGSYYPLPKGALVEIEAIAVKP